MLRIEKTTENHSEILSLFGEVDASNSVILDEAIQELVDGGSKSILIDGKNLEYISSAGLGVFMSYLEDFQENGISMKICDLVPRVFEVFKILGLDQLIPIYKDRAAAFAD
ncbi:MAG: STAS domain-containing protein [Algoriphagus sp.]|jgi:anti-sigma B factor antagonist|uniref:STAS domain-containing protein n=1 Tax=Algoriphagus sp. TaxID=1872435 RepID=UPI00271E042E|nr:STAS domain-containing protein [Algoriphagus sp.]MDO8968520.1 STAS domain-containing protein [Algoriphagus sp.]MDP2041051.1 STAS domain-containing protein [Algoriphagus sp.]MDP3200703.1 STAS domain-containing protein [Algoriphagus sp.]MDP3470464.1 STAS domain-containing protein [Algoriphagus sp.]